MAELTQEQIERAAEEYKRIFNGAMCEKRSLRAAAPFLQLPWDEPNEREVRLIADEVLGHGERDSMVREVITAIVRRRNAALMPKPVDPRLGVIFPLLNEVGTLRPGEDMTAIANRILAALDAVK